MFYLTKKRKIYLGIAALVFIIVVVQIFFLKKEDPPVFVEVRQTENSMVIESGIGGNTETVEEKIVVDIKGAVNNPDVYYMKDGDRIQDALDLAGGTTDEADLSQINLAMKVYDEMLLCIPRKEEASDCKPIGTSAGIISDGKININTASEEELMQLPGIGSAKAKAIIEYRTKNGKFKTLEDIMNVSGIKTNTFVQFEDKISLH